MCIRKKTCKPIKLKGGIMNYACYIDQGSDFSSQRTQFIHIQIISTRYPKTGKTSWPIL